MTSEINFKKLRERDSINILIGQYRMVMILVIVHLAGGFKATNNKLEIMSETLLRVINLCAMGGFKITF